MDDKWFKKRQKMAGITAEHISEALNRDRSAVSRIYVGRQKMTFDQAKVFARLLDVPLQDVLVRAGIADQQTAQAVQPGFSDSDAAPWRPKPGDLNNLHVTDFARFLGADRPGVDIWRVKSDAMQAGGYLQGDFILVDTHRATAARKGDVVIAQVYDWQAGAATTVLRRYAAPVLVAAGAGPDAPDPHIVDNNSVKIMGVVTASWRA